jgi:hypothetical protein
VVSTTAFWLWLSTVVIVVAAIALVVSRTV